MVQLGMHARKQAAALQEQQYYAFFGLKKKQREKCRNILR
jgi:hypothetical protein